MAHKRPELYLTNGKKHLCWHCRCDLVFREHKFEMKSLGNSQPIMVNETVLYCPKCNFFHITQAMSIQLVKRYPGYYVDTSTYRLKSTKKTKNTAIKELIQSDKQEETPSSVNPVSYQPKEINPSSVNAEPDSINTSASGLNTKVYLSNTYCAANDICPLCSSVLKKELVNIPVINQNGDFFRYYSEKVNYCYKCRKAYISKEVVVSILSIINRDANNQKSIKLENVTVHRDSSVRGYLFAPTLSNTDAVFCPGQDYKRIAPEPSGEMILNNQSFLGKMGYSVNRSIVTRRQILLKAVQIYGKRRVCDHIAFLIANRKAQENGEIKYANALYVWQKDLNYLSTL